MGVNLPCVGRLSIEAGTSIPWANTKMTLPTYRCTKDTVVWLFVAEIDALDLLEFQVTDLELIPLSERGLGCVQPVGHVANDISHCDTEGTHISCTISGLRCRLSFLHGHFSIEGCHLSEYKFSPDSHQDIY